MPGWKRAAFRDPTRGGLASTLNEFANTAHVDIRVDEEAWYPCMTSCAVPARCSAMMSSRWQTRGKMVCVCAPEVADAALAAMRTDKYGAEAAIVGEVLEGEGARVPSHRLWQRAHPRYARWRAAPPHLLASCTSRALHISMR